jgi:hypothetical protein
MSTRLPSLQEVLVAQFEYQSSQMYTAIPAIVVSVKNLAEQRIDVQPTLNLRSEDGDNIEERPVILNVPLHMPLTKDGGLTYPISVGTPVFLMFSMRGIDIWKRGNGYPVTPSDNRKFDIKDCVAIPGIFPFPESRNNPSSRVNSHDVNDVVLVHNIGSGAEVEIRLKPNGDVIVNSPTKVTVNCIDAEINADSTTTINCPENTINGNTTVNGDFTATSGAFTVNSGSIAMSATASATMDATFEMTGSLVLNGTPVESHDHSGVTSGPDRTGRFNE